MATMDQPLLEMTMRPRQDPMAHALTDLLSLMRDALLVGIAAAGALALVATALAA